MLVDLHGVNLECLSSNLAIRERWAHSFASRPAFFGLPPDIRFQLNLAAAVPAPPDGECVFTQGDLLAVYRAGPQVCIHFPRFGRLLINLISHDVEGFVVQSALDAYGVFEDLVAMGLASLLRRHGLFLIHAFAASVGHRALLLVGDIGSGKTTTGLSLLSGGWKLLSNDSPLLKFDVPLHPVDSELPGPGRVLALSYPGLISAYAETLRRFPELHAVPVQAESDGGQGLRRKISFAAESVYPAVWAEAAPVSALVFPRVAHLDAHRFTRLGEADTLRRLLPNAIDRWDAEMIPQHLYLLKTLAGTVPAYVLELGEDVASLPRMLDSILAPWSVLS